MTSAELEFHLAMRSEITIDASPAIVWSFLDRPRDWKPSIVSLECIAGTRGTEGEMLRVGQRPAGETVHVIMQALRLVPPSWRVQTLVSEHSRAVDGFVLYSLSPIGSATGVSCEFVARCRVPTASIGGRTLEVFAHELNEATARKLDADHQMLKELVERSA